MKAPALLGLLACSLVLLPLHTPAQGKQKQGEPQVLPAPTWENSFQLWIQRTDGLEMADWTVEHKEVVQRLGKGGLYLRLNYDCSKLPDDYRAEHGLYQSYAWNSPLDSWNPAYNTPDRRARQWDQANQLVSEADKKKHGNPADNDLTLSGCCAVVNEGTEKYIKDLAVRYLREQAEKRFKIFAGPNEYGRIFYMGDERWFDYGPYTQTEFRDWLCHKGEFAKGGRYEGKGCPGGERFSDDPSPEKAQGKGTSFNAAYGTKFTTWQLKYWDLEAFPGELPHSAKGMPAAGERGFVEGGFDAPRAPGQPLWALWNCAREEAPGFLQWRIHQSMIEYVKIAFDAGVPKSEIWTRQHGLHYDPAREGKARNIEMAPWMNVTPWSQMGFNTYGAGSNHQAKWREAGRIAAANGVHWGSFEVHPAYKDPFAMPAATYLQCIRGYYDNGAHLFRAACWGGRVSAESAHGINKGDMLIKGTPFEAAIREFLATAPDRPLGSDPAARWLAPAPRNLSLQDGTLSWDTRMWDGEPFSYADWAAFEGFEVVTAEGLDEKGRPRNSRKLAKLKRDEGCSLKSAPEKLKAIVLVRGISQGGLEGPWSEPLTVAP
ncbi:MAG: hypothetical protein IT463_13165 [Planctomycetes bacterium]|nr:hypothetical protein [Planctomycetota bacterium]